VLQLSHYDKPAADYGSFILGRIAGAGAGLNG